MRTAGRFLFYRGGVGMWAWLLHRATGLGILGFLLLHIADTALLLAGPEAYDHIVALYRAPYFRVLEVGLAASVLYHALNGLRVILIDFSEAATRRQRAIFYLMMTLFIMALLPAAYIMLAPVFNPPRAE